MGKIKLTDFKGQNRKVTRINLKPNQFYTLRDARVDKEIGKIMIRGGLLAKYTSSAPQTIDGAIHKIINYFIADGTEKLLLIEEGSSTGWGVQEGTASALIAILLADTGIARGSHEPNVVIHNDVVRVYLGNIGGSNPLLTNLWYGLVDTTFFNNVNSDSNFDAYYLSSANLLNYIYHDNIAITDLGGTHFYTNKGLQTGGSSGSTNIVNAVYRITYILDGFQETTFIRTPSTLSGGSTAGDIMFACREWGVTVDSHNVEIRILASNYSNSDRANSSNTEFNKRITGINIYRTADVSQVTESDWNGGQDRPEPDTDASWYLVKSLDVEDTTWAFVTESTVVSYRIEFNDTITDANLTNQQLYDTRIGHTSASDFADISYAVFHKSRMWAIKVFDRETDGTTGTNTNDRLYYSTAQVVSTGTNQALDSFANLNFIFIGQGDGDIPTGIVEWGDRLLIFKQDHRYRIFVAATIANSFVEETINKGCYAPRSLVKTSFGIFFLARDTVYIFNGTRDVEIGTAIEPQLQTYTTAQLKAAFAVFDNEQQQYKLSITSGGVTDEFVLSMRNSPPEWTQNRYYNGTAGLTITDANYLPDNKIYMAIDNNGTFSIDKLDDDNADDNGVSIRPLIQSKFYMPATQDNLLLFTKVAIRHKGREFILTLFTPDTGTGETTLGTITFSDNTNLFSIIKQIDQKYQGNEVYFNIQKSVDAGSETDFQIDDIEFDVEETKRILT